MIETNNPEINVDLLMQQVKREAQKRAERKALSDAKVYTSPISDADSVFTSRLQALLQDSEYQSSYLVKPPEKFNRFPFNTQFFSKILLFLIKSYNFLFKKQRVINKNLVHALNLIQQMLALVESGAKTRHETLVAEVKTLGSEVTTRHETLVSEVATCHETLRAEVKALESEVATCHETLRAEVKALESEVATRHETLRAEVKALQIELSDYKKLLASFLEEAKKQIPVESKLEKFVQESEHLLDAFYVSFEDRFRGSSEEIRDRLSIYLPILEKAEVKRSSLIVDLGCGRGEWIELLKENTYSVKGIDVNRAMIAQCKSKNLDVEEADAITYLQSLPSESVGAVTGFHIIEHLPFAILLQLLAETIRVLKSGGIAIFETPNPQNILVGSKSFYIDPTHRQPLPSELTQFLVEKTGFQSVEVLPLHPYDDSTKVDGTEAVTARFNEYFYGPQDYAVLGYKLP